MKNNYPIKYAAMPIYEHSGYQYGLNELEDTYDIALYIVSKCYLIEESIKYLEDGNKKNIFKVVFTFEKKGYYSYDTIVRSLPHYNIYGQSTNSVIVDKIFDDFESCYIETERLNREILGNKIGCLPYNDKVGEMIKKLKTEYNEKNMEYRELEKKIEDGTSDLVANDIPKKQYIIVSKCGKMELKKVSLYRFISYSDKYNFCVYNVTSNEFDNMCSQIDNEEKIDINSSDLLLYHKKDSDITLITNCNNNINNGSFYLKKRGMYYDKDIVPFHLDETINIDESFIKIYTLENYEDIIKSFIPYYIEDGNKEIELGNKVLAKTINLGYL